MLLLAGSCQQEKLQTAGEEVLVTLDVQIPAEAQTKTISKAELTDIVYFEVWSADWSKKFTVTPSSAAVENCQAQVTLSLVKDQTYNFIFWAQNKDCGAYTTTELKSVKVDYAKIAADGNQDKDKYDAFYAVKPFTITGPIKETVKLYRPFAQLNFGATKMATSLGAITVGATEVTVSAGLATSFNTVEGKGEDLTTAPVTFKASGLVSSTETLDVDLNKNGSYEADEKFTWVSMDYMLMADESATYTIDAVFNVNGVGAVKHNLSYVPLKKNFRTNIVGDLFTSDANLTIIVDPDFNKPDEVILNNHVLEVTSADMLKSVLATLEDGDIIRLADGTFEGVFLAPEKNFSVVASNAGAATISGKFGIPAGATVRFENLNFAVSANTLASTSNQHINRAGKYIIPIYDGKVSVYDCTFTGMSDAEGTGAINQYAANFVGLTVVNSTFTGARAIRAQGSVSVENCTFDGLDRQCLQVLGNPDYPENQTVVFKENKALNAGSGICGVSLATGNQLMKDMTFDVSGNDAVINNIADDGKNPAKLLADTFEFTGEVTTIIPEP